MKKAKSNYFDLDLIRLISCIAVLLYHLGILKGGYLAVCTFFVLSGYLSVKSAFNKEKFSLLEYYKNRILKIYLPLFIVVFGTLSVISLFPDIIWLNLKPEMTSVLLGYNNIWQLTANLDYFTKQITSPFIHFWYIAILLQFDLLFPYVYLLLKKIGEKANKLLPCLISLVLSIGGFAYLYFMSRELPLMSVYYGSLTRVFSLLFGVTIGLVHHYYGQLLPEKFKEKLINRFIFYFYVALLTFLFIWTKADSKYFVLAFLATTIISCRLLDYGTIFVKHKLSIFEKPLKFLASLSYEIYLFQYPVIYMFQRTELSDAYKLVLIIITTLILSYLLHLVTIIKKGERLKVVKWIIRGIVVLITLYGAYQFVIAKDHSAEMKELERQLAENQKVVEQSQQDYSEKIKEEQAAWEATLLDLENGEEKISGMVKNISLVGIGDSVMLGAVATMKSEFPNGYFDAAVSRSAWVVEGILSKLKSKNSLGDHVVFNLGANGDCSQKCKEKIMTDLGDRRAFWMTVTNDKDVHFNDKIKKFAEGYDNLHIIDWEAISKGHSEYFYADGLHLTGTGRKAYTKAIYDAIYKIYLGEFNAKKEEMIKKHEAELKTKIAFYGNDILLNTYEQLQTNYADSKLNLNKDYTFDQLVTDINTSIADDTLSHRLLFAFDESLELNTEQYKKLIELCDKHDIYIVTTNEKNQGIIKEINNKSVHVIDFYEEIKKHNDYLMVDRVHLSTTGNEEFVKIIVDNLNK